MKKRTRICPKHKTKMTLTDPHSVVPSQRREVSCFECGMELQKAFNDKVRANQRRLMKLHKLARFCPEAPPAIVATPPAGGKLAWIRFNGLVEAQKWAIDCPAPYVRKNNGRELGHDLVCMWPLTAAEMSEPIAALAARYPIPDAAAASPGASGPIVVISDPGTPSTEVYDYGQPRALPDPQDAASARAGAHRRWEDALVEAVVSRLPFDRFGGAPAPRV